MTAELVPEATENYLLACVRDFNHSALNNALGVMMGFIDRLQLGCSFRKMSSSRYKNRSEGLKINANRWALLLMGCGIVYPLGPLCTYGC